jgi:GNAT superfamily N-acetyltransferase
MDGEIQSFYILRPYQRLGIGTALLGKFIDWLTSTEAKSLCVGIASSNRYKAFYLKYGGVYLNEHWIFWTDIAQVRKLTSNFLLNSPKKHFI